MKFQILVFIITTNLSYFAHAEQREKVESSKPSSINEVSVVTQANTLISKLIKIIPDKGLSDGLAEYLKVVNPAAYEEDGRVGGSNMGIKGYFEERFRFNQCFQRSAVGFYKDLAALLKKQNPCDIAGAEPEAPQASSTPPVKHMFTDYGCYNGRPKLTDRAGEGAYKNLRPGWLLDLAMKHAQGNSAAALELIAICGHDDTAHGFFTYIDKSEAAREKNLAEIKDLAAQKAEVDADIKEAVKSYDKNQQEVYDLVQGAASIKYQIDNLRWTEGREESLDCPSNQSDFFLQGSLAQEADIPIELKKQISIVQRADAGQSVSAPAKHYHVYGSAMLGCKLVSKGMKPEQAVMVQKQAARVYRGIRMCETTRRSIEGRNKLISEIGESTLNDAVLVEKKIKALLKNQKKCFRVENTPPWCDVIVQIGLFALSPEEVDQIGAKKIRTFLKRSDAAKLYDNWYVGGGTIAGKIKIPCTDIQNFGPKNLLKPQESFMGKLSKPSGWSDERYENASKLLATWDMDFKWTIAQHEAGSKFGAKICSANKKPNPFEDPSCKLEGGSERSGGSQSPVMILKPMEIKGSGGIQ